MLIVSYFVSYLNNVNIVNLNIFYYEKEYFLDKKDYINE